MRRTYPSSDMPPPPFASTSTSFAPNVTFSSTRPLPMREALQIDDLLQSQRVRLEEKEREARELRRRVQQLSAQSPIKAKKKHPLLDTKWRKRTPQRRTDKGPVTVKVEEAASSPPEKEEGEEQGEVEDKDGPFYAALSSTLHDRLSPPVLAPSPPSVSSQQLEELQSQLSQLSAALSLERQCREAVEEEVGQLRAEREEMEERIRKVRDGGWEEDGEERQRLTQAIAQREQRERHDRAEREAQDRERETRADEMREALREAINHLQQKNAEIEMMESKEQIWQQKLKEAQEVIENLQSELEANQSSPQPPSPSPSNSMIEDLQSQMEQLRVELENREEIIVQQRRKLKRLERETSKRESLSSVSPLKIPPAISGLLNVVATFNPSFSLFSSSPSSLITFITLNTLPPATSQPSTGLTPSYTFLSPVFVPFASPVTLSIHLQTGDKSLLLTSLPLPTPFSPSSAEVRHDVGELIGIIEWTVNDRPHQRAEEEKQPIEYSRQEFARGSAAPSHNKHKTLTLLVHSCSLLRQSRLQLHAQCGELGIAGPLMAVSSSSSSALHFPLPLPCPWPETIGQAVVQIFVYDHKHPASPLAYFCVSLEGIKEGRLGEKKAEWMPVLHPRSELPIGSIELGLTWTDVE